MAKEEDEKKAYGREAGPFGSGLGLGRGLGFGLGSGLRVRLGLGGRKSEKNQREACLEEALEGCA